MKHYEKIVKIPKRPAASSAERARRSKIATSAEAIRARAGAQGITGPTPSFTFTREDANSQTLIVKDFYFSRAGKKGKAESTGTEIFGGLGSSLTNPISRTRRPRSVAPNPLRER